LDYIRQADLDKARHNKACLGDDSLDGDSSVECTVKGLRL